jgi:hypothetical protein
MKREETGDVLHQCGAVRRVDLPFSAAGCAVLVRGVREAVDAL